MPQSLLQKLLLNILWKPVTSWDSAQQNWTNILKNTYPIPLNPGQIFQGVELEKMFLPKGFWFDVSVLVWRGLGIRCALTTWEVKLYFVQRGLPNLNAISLIFALFKFYIEVLQHKEEEEDFQQFRKELEEHVRQTVLRKGALVYQVQQEDTECNLFLKFIDQAIDLLSENEVCSRLS